MIRLMPFVLWVSALAVPTAIGQKPPAPLGSPPSFVRVASVDRENVTLEVAVPVTVQKTGTRVREVDGRKVAEAYTYTETKYETVAKKVPAADVRLGTIAGKPVPLSQGVGKVVVQAATADGVEAAYRPLFADGTLVLTPAKK